MANPLQFVPRRLLAWLTRRQLERIYGPLVRPKLPQEKAPVVSRQVPLPWRVKP